jgi:glycosyltransferase involved in cell wall biosynthesis
MMDGRFGSATQPHPHLLVIHNRYQQAGGEDSVFANEVALLREGGVTVDTLEVSNDALVGRAAQLSAALRVVSNPEGRRLTTEAIARFRPDIVHVHNFFPRLSPALFDACAEAGVPAVWTLHNFRIGCANGLLFRDGQPCEDCIGRVPWPAIQHRCYRGSTAGSAAVASMIGWHRARGTWRHKVARFIALSDFARNLFVRAGVPDDRLAVKPNFVADPLPALQGAPPARQGAVFAGRLSREKGAATLVAAWRALPDIPLTILGDGPDFASLQAAAPPNVRFLGFQNRDAVLQAMRGAQALVVPSTWYENFPMTVVEAMALGTPVIASRIGALATIVGDGVDGLHFAPGDADDLAAVVRAAFADPALLARLGAGARATWADLMSPERNLEMLLVIYRDAMTVGTVPELRRAG